MAKVKFDEFEWAEPSEVEEALAGLPTEGSVIYLYRVQEKTRRKAFIEKLEPGDFDVAEIKRKYGGGRFCSIGKENGKMTVCKYFEIDGPPVIQLAAAPPPGPAPFSPEVESLRSKISDMERLLQTHQPTEALVLLIKDMLAASARPTLAFDEDKFLDRLAKYKMILGGAEQARDPVGLFKSILQVIPSVLELAPGGEPANPWTVAVREFAPRVLDILNGVVVAMNKPPAKPSPAQMATAPALTTANTPPEPPAQSVPSAPPWLDPLKAYIPKLIDEAAEDTDPEVFVDRVVDALPVTEYSALEAWLKTPGCLNDLATIAPAVWNQRAWWREFQNALLHELAERVHGIRRDEPSEDSDASAVHARSRPADAGPGEGPGD